MRKSALAVCAFAALIPLGCGAEAAKTPVTANGAGSVSSGENEVIDDALLKAGIKKKRVAVFDDGAYWTVSLAPEGYDPNATTAPSGPPTRPEQVTIDKQTKKVTGGQESREGAKGNERTKKGGLLNPGGAGP